MLQRGLSVAGVWGWGLSRCIASLWVFAASVDLSEAGVVL